MVTAVEVKEITLKDAAAKYSIPEDTIHVWIYRGHIRRIATRKHGAGRPQMVIDENELLGRINR